MNCLNCGSLTSEVNPTIRTLYLLSVEASHICTKCMLSFSEVLIHPKTPCNSPIKYHKTAAQYQFGQANEYDNCHYMSKIN